MEKFPDNWQEGHTDDTTTRLLLKTLRTGTAEEASLAVIETLNQGVSPTSIWDAIFCSAAELQFRSPNIVSLHAVTTSRAIHYAYLTTMSNRLRRLLLLQNAALVPLFRDAAKQRGRFIDQPIEALEPIAPEGSDKKAVKRIMEDLGGQRRTAAQRIASLA